ELDLSFGVPIAWDRPLLDGYRSTFLTRRDPATRGGRIVTFANAGRLIAEFRRQRFDAVLVHSYATATSVLGYLAAVLSGTPILLRTEPELLRPRRAWVRHLKALYVGLVVRLTKGFLVIGSANRAFYQSYGVGAPRLFDTPYAVDNDFF